MTSPAYTRTPLSDDVEAVLPAAIKRAQGWLDSTADEKDKATEQLAELLRDDNGVKFTMDFVDRVMRPKDDKVAAKALKDISSQYDPSFLGSINGALVGATVCQSGTDLGGDRQHQRKRVAGVGTRCGSTPVARTDRVRQVESLG